MERNTIRWIALAAFVIALIWLALSLDSGDAHADPGDSCVGLHDPRLCEPSKVFYCPSTGTMQTWLQSCPAWSIGPYAPGGPTPNGDDD